MTQYYIQITADFRRSIERNIEEGRIEHPFRFIERLTFDRVWLMKDYKGEPHIGTQGGLETWIVEDAAAPASVEGKLVTPRVTAHTNLETGIQTYAFTGWEVAEAVSA